MTTIFADECGYTGPDLLDIAQPVFVIATLKMDETEAAERKRQFFAGDRGAELKHARLARRGRGQTQILRFMRWLDKRRDLVRIAYMHKEFGLVAKMVDWIIEPSYRRHGHDLYADGLNISLANLTYMVLRTVERGAFLRRLLTTFQQLVRQPTPTHLQDYVDVLLSRDEPECVEQVLQIHRGAIADLGVYLLQLLQPACLDVAWAFSYSIMADWSTRCAAPFRVIMDMSTEFAEEKELWDAVVTPGAEPKIVGRDRRVMRFPIGVSETTLASSQDWSGLQLADVLAGAVARAGRCALPWVAENDRFARDLFEIVGTWTASASIWPSPDVTPEDLGTIGPAFDDPIAHIESIRRRIRS